MNIFSRGIVKGRLMELSELGRNPISEQEPAGKDVRYEPDFEALSQEVEKLSSLENC